MSFCSLIKGITPKICADCVFPKPEIAHIFSDFSNGYGSLLLLLKEWVGNKGCELKFVCMGPQSSRVSSFARQDSCMTKNLRHDAKLEKVKKVRLGG